MQKTALVIMAAGFGTRFGGGVKQLTRFGRNGALIIDFSVYDALRAGFNQVVFVIRRELEADFRALIGDRIAKIVPVHYVYQEKEALPEGFACPGFREKPWGTGQAVLACREVVDSPFAVINADDFYGRTTIERIYSALQQLSSGEKVFGCMAGYVLKNTLSEYGGVTRGVCQVENGRLMSISEVYHIEKTATGAASVARSGIHIPISPECCVSMNIWGFTPRVFDFLEAEFCAFLQENLQSRNAEFVLPTIIGRLIDAGQAEIRVLPTDERWFGVTYKEDVPLAEQKFRALIESGTYPETLII